MQTPSFQQGQWPSPEVLAREAAPAQTTHLGLDPVCSRLVAAQFSAVALTISQSCFLVASAQASQLLRLVSYR